eukprot:scaffold205610_cov14-Prasinocladus_malaysianus.AAC.1
MIHRPMRFVHQHQWSPSFKHDLFHSTDSADAEWIRRPFLKREVTGSIPGGGRSGGNLARTSAYETHPPGQVCGNARKYPPRRAGSTTPVG